MPVNRAAYAEIKKALDAQNVQLVAVSKTKPAEDIMELYDLGQRDFGENYVQELVDKQATLPSDIRWHFIGHLQSNKVKQIAAFVHLIHGVDSSSLLQTIDKAAERVGRRIPVLLQVHIATEATKFGLLPEELLSILSKETGDHNYELKGLMGMASFTDDEALVQREFRSLAEMYRSARETPAGRDFSVLSMGMSGDYDIAVKEGSNLVRIGSLLFGNRKAH